MTNPIVTYGFGPNATIPFMVTFGFGIGVAHASVILTATNTMHINRYGSNASKIRRNETRKFRIIRVATNIDRL